MSRALGNVLSARPEPSVPRSGAQTSVRHSTSASGRQISNAGANGQRNPVTRTKRRDSPKTSRLLTCHEPLQMQRQPPLTALLSAPPAHDLNCRQHALSRLRRPSWTTRCTREKQKRTAGAQERNEAGQTCAGGARDDVLSTGLCEPFTGVARSKNAIHLQFGGTQTLVFPPAPKQRSLREQRRKASPAQSEDSKRRAPARACSAAAHPWVLCNRLCRSRVHDTPASANCRSQALAALETLRHL